MIRCCLVRVRMARLLCGDCSPSLLQEWKRSEWFGEKWEVDIKKTSRWLPWEERERAYTVLHGVRRTCGYFVGPVMMGNWPLEVFLAMRYRLCLMIFKEFNQYYCVLLETQLFFCGLFLLILKIPFLSIRFYYVTYLLHVDTDSLWYFCLYRVYWNG